MESKGTITSEIKPGSQYAASSSTMMSPLTPFNDCAHLGRRPGKRVSGRLYALSSPVPPPPLEPAAEARLA